MKHKSSAHEQHRLTSAENHFVQVLGLFFGADAVSSVFLSLFLFRSDGFGPIAKYWLGFVVVLTFGMIVGNYMLKTRTTRRLIRLGLLLFCAEYLVVLIIGSNAAQVPILIGCLHGVASSMFWSGVTVTEFVVTHEHSRDLYMGKRTLWQNTSRTVAQIAAGAVLGLFGLVTSRENSYLVIFAVLVLAYGVAFHHARSIESFSGVRLRLRDSLHKPPSPGWTLSLVSQYFRGLTDIALLVLPPVLTYIVIQSDFFVGAFSGAVTLLGGLLGLVAGRLLQRNRQYYLVGVIGMSLGLMAFGYFPGWPGLFGYVLVMATGSFIAIPVYSSIYNAMDRSGLSWQYSSHYLIENEIVLDMGRATGFVIVLAVIPAEHQVAAVRNVLLLFALAPLALGVLQYKINAKLAASK